MDRTEAALNAAIEKEYASNAQFKVRRFGLSAFVMGWEAAWYGDRQFCPYPDVRTDRGNVTFARGYRRKWEHGRAAYHAYEASVLARAKRKEIEELGYALSSQSSCRMKAIGMGWNPDWSKSIHVLNAEAKVIVMATIADLAALAEQLEQESQP